MTQAQSGNAQQGKRGCTRPRHLSDSSCRRLGRGAPTVPAQAFRSQSNLSVGKFITLAESVASVQKVTWQGYVTAFRRIVSDSFNLDLGKKKFDPHGGGNQEWVQRVNAVKLAKVTPQKIQQWKRSFLSLVASDPISQRSAKTSVNTYLGQGGGGPEVGPNDQTYVVQLRDTLDGIGAHFDTQVACIAQNNNITPANLVYPGQTVVIPASCPKYDGFDIVTNPRSS